MMCAIISMMVAVVAWVNRKWHDEDRERISKLERELYEIKKRMIRHDY